MKFMLIVVALLAPFARNHFIFVGARSSTKSSRIGNKLTAKESHNAQMVLSAGSKSAEGESDDGSSEAFKDIKRRIAELDGEILDLENKQQEKDKQQEKARNNIKKKRLAGNDLEYTENIGHNVYNDNDDDDDDRELVTIVSRMPTPLESAKEKLRIQKFPFVDLPNDAHSYLWPRVRIEYGLTLAELLALKEAVQGDQLFVPELKTWTIGTVQKWLKKNNFQKEVVEKFGKWRGLAMHGIQDRDVMVIIPGSEGGRLVGLLDSQRLRSAPPPKPLEIVTTQDTLLALQSLESAKEKLRVAKIMFEALPHDPKATAWNRIVDMCSLTAAELAALKQNVADGRKPIVIAKEKLRRGGFPFDALPTDANSPGWLRIRSEYSLTLSEFIALKNAVYAEQQAKLHGSQQGGDIKGPPTPQLYHFRIYFAVNTTLVICIIGVIVSSTLLCRLRAQTRKLFVVAPSKIKKKIK